MSRPYALLAAAAAGALLAAAAATAPAGPTQRPPRGEREERAMRVFTGASERGQLQEALDRAVAASLRSLPGADRMVRYRVREITGEQGGIQGVNTVRVSIEVPAEGLPAAPPAEGAAGSEDAARRARAALRVSPPRVERGEPVTLSFTVENPSREPIVVPQATGQRYEFEVLREGRVMWRWSDGRFFTLALGSLTIPANGRLSYTVTWDQRARDGSRVPPGEYEARAFLPQRVSGDRVEASAPLVITER